MKIMFFLKFVMGLSLLLFQDFSFADTPNAFAAKKLSSEAIVTGVESCSSGFEKGRRSQGRWSGSKDDQLLARYYCSCALDGQRKFSIKQMDSYAQTCLDDASVKISNSNKGIQFRLNNIFDKDEYAAAAILVAFYTCEEREGKSKKHNWPKKFGQKSLYCSCLMDYFREVNNSSLTKYVESDISIDSAVQSKCEGIAKTRK